MHRRQPAYQEGINFYEQKPNKKFFKLNPRVENEEKLQRLILWGSGRLGRQGKAQLCPSSCSPPGLGKKLELLPPGLLQGLFGKRGAAPCPLGCWHLGSTWLRFKRTHMSKIASPSSGMKLPS